MGRFRAVRATAICTWIRGAFNRDPTVGGLRFASPITSAQEARSGVGVNWYWNKDLKFVLDYDRQPSMAGRDSDSVRLQCENRETEEPSFHVSSSHFNGDEDGAEPV